MAEDQRPPGADQVDVAAPVGVEQVRALAPHHEPGRAADGAERAHGRVDPARHDRAGAVKEVLRGRGVCGYDSPREARVTARPFCQPVVGDHGVPHHGAQDHDRARLIACCTMTTHPAAPPRRQAGPDRAHPPRRHRGRRVRVAGGQGRSGHDRLPEGGERVHRGAHRRPGRSARDDLQRDQDPDEGDRPVGARAQGRVLVLHPHGRGPAVRHPLPSRRRAGRDRAAVHRGRQPAAPARRCCSTATSRPATPSSSRSAPST